MKVEIGITTKVLAIKNDLPRPLPYYTKWGRLNRHCVFWNYDIKVSKILSHLRAADLRIIVDNLACGN